MIADLHIHSCLSPCATLQMSPSRIAREAAAKGIGLLALTDHNSAQNCPAFAEACKREKIIPLFGMEVTTIEEAHALALFEDLDAALAADEWVTSQMLPMPVKESVAYEQPVVDVEGNILRFMDTLLISATEVSTAQLVAYTHRQGGLVIPCHLDRAAFSIETQLGFLPADEYDAIEVLPPSVGRYTQRYPAYAVITNSDAHSPDRIGFAPTRLNTTGSLASLRSAFQALHARQQS